MVPFSLGLALALVALGILIVLGFGLRSMAYGKHDVNKLIAMAVPFVLFGISLVITDNSVRAGILTMLLMLGLMALLVVVTGLRNLFNT